MLWADKREKEGGGGGGGDGKEVGGQKGTQEHVIVRGNLCNGRKKNYLSQITKAKAGFASIKNANLVNAGCSCQEASLPGEEGTHKSQR